MRRIRNRLTYANVVSTLCLFALLGGVGYAAKTLPKNSVGSEQIKPQAVATSDLSPKAVAPRAAVADSIPQLVLPNPPDSGGDATGEAAFSTCAPYSAGSTLVSLRVGQSCRFGRPPFTIGVVCQDLGNQKYLVAVTATTSADRWWYHGWPPGWHSANDVVKVAQLTADRAEGTLFTGPVLQTADGESLTLNEMGLGVHQVDDCSAYLYGFA